MHRKRTHDPTTKTNILHFSERPVCNCKWENKLIVEHLCSVILQQNIWRHSQFLKLTLWCIPGTHIHFWVYDISQLPQQGAQHLRRGKWLCDHSDFGVFSSRNPGTGAGRSGHQWPDTAAGTKVLCLEGGPPPKEKHYYLPFYLQGGICNLCNL